MVQRYSSVSVTTCPPSASNAIAHSHMHALTPVNFRTKDVKSPLMLLLYRCIAMSFPSPRLYRTPLIRFAINGAGVALVAVTTYYLCAVILSWSPLLANFVAYVTQLALGYHIHRAHSFRQNGANFPSIMRYLVMSAAAFALNSLWVWLLTQLLELASWTPIIPMITVTPVMTFLVARYWVFRAAAAITHN